MRISLFGGSTDYKSFYEKHGSFIIGATINKHSYSTIRFRPSLVGNKSVIKYSKLEVVEKIDEIQNPLIREVLRYYNVNKPIELNLDSDVPSRTGLGGSSSCCAALSNAICLMMKLPFNPEKLCADAIKIEREILNEPGGIQDQIWACYGSHGDMKSITIDTDGAFSIADLPGSKEFHKEFRRSLILIYSKQQRQSSAEAKSQDVHDKMEILKTAKEAYFSFEKEDIKNIGKLLYHSWLEKRSLSNLISDPFIDTIIDDTMNMGAYGTKLLGSGGGGFVLAICNPDVKKRLKEKYKDSVLSFQLSKGFIHTTSI
jgi:D-glycero-alpha-D-manno-heptose-7-phosphate kinase